MKACVESVSPSSEKAGRDHLLNDTSDHDLLKTLQLLIQLGADVDQFGYKHWRAEDSEVQKDCIRWEDCVLDSNAFSHAVLNLLESHSRRECGWKDQLQWIDLQAELVGAIERGCRDKSMRYSREGHSGSFLAAAPRSSTDWTGSLLSKALHSAILSWRTVPTTAH